MLIWVVIHFLIGYFGLIQTPVEVPYFLQVVAYMDNA